MSFEERVANTTIANLAYGISGILSMIPILQEISLDKKLNEEKTNIEKDAFRPDLIARHIQNNRASLIGCDQNCIQQFREKLTGAEIPFITVSSNMISDETKRLPFFYTIVIRDIDSDRAAIIVQDVAKEYEQQFTDKEPDKESPEQEEEIERTIDQEAVQSTQSQTADETAKTQEDDDQSSYIEEDEWEDEREEDKKKQSNKSSGRDRSKKLGQEKKREQERHREEIRREDERKRENRKYEEDTHRQSREHTKTPEFAATAGERREYPAHSETAGDYREAYAIRARDLEKQNERYAQLELLKRNIERNKLLGKTKENRELRLKEQYRHLSEEIKVHDERFRSIGQSGWREYAAETIRRIKESDTNTLKENRWERAAYEDYLKPQSDGSYSAYTREEKKRYFDQKYKNGSLNVDLHGYVEDALKTVALRRKEELATARSDLSTQDGLRHYQELLSRYDVTDKEVEKYNVHKIRKELSNVETDIIETERKFAEYGINGYKDYKEVVIQEATTQKSSEFSKSLISHTPLPNTYIKNDDGTAVNDFRDQKFSRAAYENLYPEEAIKQLSNAPVGFKRSVEIEKGIFQIASGYSISKLMNQTSQSIPPNSGGVLIGTGAKTFDSMVYLGKGSASQISGDYNSKLELCQGNTSSRPLYSMTGADEQMPKELTLKFKREQQKIKEADKNRIDITRARARNAAADMMRNRYFSTMIKRGCRLAVQSAVGDTESGRVVMDATDSARVPAHLIKERILKAGMTQIDQTDTAMESLNRHIIRAKAAGVANMDEKDLESFAKKAGMTIEELKGIQTDEKKIEQIIERQYSGTFKTPSAQDMKHMISAMGIRADLEKDNVIGTEDILRFLSHHDQTTMAERTRALKNIEGNLNGLNEAQKRLITSLFDQSKFLSVEDMRELLARNGIKGDLMEKLSGGNWAFTADLNMALTQANVPDSVKNLLMQELKGISAEDRAAMIGLYQLYVGNDIKGLKMDQFRDLINVLNVDQALKADLNLNYIHLSHLSLNDIRALLQKHKGNREAEVFLTRLLNEKIGLVMGRNHKFSRYELWNGMQNMLFKVAKGSDAIQGFSQVMSIGRAMSRISRSTYRMLYGLVFRRMKPIELGKLRINPEKLTAHAAKEAAIKTVKNTKIAAKFSEIITRRVPHAAKIANHAIHPGRYIGHAIGKKVEWFLVKHGVDTAAFKSAVSAVSAKFTEAAATASSFFMEAAVVILIIIAVLLAYESIDLGSQEPYSAAYVSAADGREAFAQEVIDLLRNYTEEFIDEINNAQYNRGMYSGMAGFNTNESVSAFESGAYQVVFRGPDGEPIEDIQNVDINNSKDIISMASVFIPTAFQKPGEGASQKAIEEYERDKEHFMDYCTFLWAASHQISIEEYHPGNSDNADANDTSGLVTDAQTGKCGMDFGMYGDKGAGVNWWIGEGVSPDHGNLCKVCTNKNWDDYDTGENECVEKPAADPCTHGHWRTITEATIRHRACTGHHHSCEEHDYWYTCADEGRSRWDVNKDVYKRVWVCDGHMGAVVYVTIGRISRMPNFGEAKDYNFDTPESFGGSGIYNHFNGSGEGNNNSQGGGVDNEND